MENFGDLFVDVQKKRREFRRKTRRNTASSLKVLDGVTCLYRHYDASGVLLYVGVSLSVVGRLRAHRELSHWFHQIDLITVQRFPTRSDALLAEKLAIGMEKPLHNKKRPGAHGITSLREEPVSRHSS